jgi:hypothetical protein
MRDAGSDAAHAAQSVRLAGRRRAAPPPRRRAGEGKGVSGRAPRGCAGRAFPPRRGGAGSDSVRRRAAGRRRAAADGGRSLLGVAGHDERFSAPWRPVKSRGPVALVGDCVCLVGRLESVWSKLRSWLRRGRGEVDVCMIAARSSRPPSPRIMAAQSGHCAEWVPP